MRLLSLLILSFLLALPAHASNHREKGESPSQEAAAPIAPPQWYLENVEFLSRDGGRWVASNADYKGENDPMDAYVIEWKKGYANSMTGRLFGVRDGKETGAFWEMFQYWDPASGEEVVTQFGFGGAAGIGRAWSGEAVIKSSQTFFGPDGSVSVVGHEARNADDDTHVTNSYDIVDGEWKPRRVYTWKRDRAASAE